MPVFHSLRRPAAVLLVGLLALMGSLGTTPAVAQDDNNAPLPASTGGAVTVMEISGRLDVILADFIERNITASEQRGDLALVLQVNSPGSTLKDGAYLELARAVSSARVPIGAWVGPSGAKARGGTAELLSLADFIAIAPGSSIGNLGDPRLPAEEFGDAFPGNTALLQSDTINQENAGQIGATGEATLPEFLSNLPGVEVETTTLDEAPQVLTSARAVGLPLSSQLMHTVASPEVAYLLLITGLALLVFELFTAGVGVAGLVGAGCLILGSYGIFALPTRWWAVALLIASMIAFSVDIQTGVPRFWSGVGALFFLIGSIWLFDGVGISWITLVVGLGGMAFTMFSGMPSMVRSRFSTPTIGRDSVSYTHLTLPTICSV